MIIIGERERAARLGAGYSEDKGIVMSEKTAKEYKEAMKSIETTTKLGGWSQIVTMASALITLSENPAFQVFMKWLDYISGRINMEFAESAERLAEALFSEETQKSIDTLANTIGAVLKLLWDLNDSINKWNEELKKATDGRLDIWIDWGTWFNNFVEDTNRLMEVFRYRGDQLKDVIGDIIDKIEDWIDTIKEMLGLD